MYIHIIYIYICIYAYPKSCYMYSYIELNCEILYTDNICIIVYTNIYIINMIKLDVIMARSNKVSIEIGKKQTELTSLYLRGRTVADNGVY
jgi:hypothetical protein